MGVYLRAKFEVSSVIVTSFRQRVILPSPPPPPQNRTLKSPPRSGLSDHVKYLIKLLLKRKTDVLKTSIVWAWNSCHQVCFGVPQRIRISLSFKTSCCNLKIRSLGLNLRVTFFLFSFWKDLWSFKIKESMHFVEQKHKL